MRRLPQPDEAVPQPRGRRFFQPVGRSFQPISLSSSSHLPPFPHPHPSVSYVYLMGTQGPPRIQVCPGVTSSVPFKAPGVLSVASWGVKARRMVDFQPDTVEGLFAGVLDFL